VNIFIVLQKHDNNIECLCSLIEFKFHQNPIHIVFTIVRMLIIQNHWDEKYKNIVYLYYKNKTALEYDV